MAREPGWCGRKEGVGCESHQREDHDHGDVAAEEASGGEPEELRSRDRSRRSSSGRRHRRRSRTNAGRATPKAFLSQTVGTLPKNRISSTRSCGRTCAERASCRHALAGGHTPKGRERTEATEDDAAKPATDVRQREGEQPEDDPDEDVAARERHAVADDHDRERDTVRRRPDPGETAANAAGSYSRSATETTEEPFTGCTVTSRT